MLKNGCVVDWHRAKSAEEVCVLLALELELLWFRSSGLLSSVRISSREQGRKRHIPHFSSTKALHSPLGSLRAPP